MGEAKPAHPRQKTSHKRVTKKSRASKTLMAPRDGSSIPVDGGGSQSLVQQGLQETQKFVHTATDQVQAVRGHQNQRLSCLTHCGREMADRGGKA